MWPLAALLAGLCTKCVHGAVVRLAKNHMPVSLVAVQPEPWLGIAPKTTVRAESSPGDA
jgi:hypothetical protein